MTLNILFVGGSKDGRVAKTELPAFEIGMEIELGEEVYVVQDGPVAKCIEATQRTEPSLCVRAALKV